MSPFLIQPPISPTPPSLWEKFEPHPQTFRKNFENSNSFSLESEVSSNYIVYSKSDIFIYFLFVIYEFTRF